MCRRKDLCGLRIYEAAVLPQKKSKLYYNSCLVAKKSPSFVKIYGKMLLYDKDEDFYILQY